MELADVLELIVLCLWVAIAIGAIAIQRQRQRIAYQRGRIDAADEMLRAVRSSADEPTRTVEVRQP